MEKILYYERQKYVFYSNCYSISIINIHKCYIIIKLIKLVMLLYERNSYCL